MTVACFEIKRVKMEGKVTELFDRELFEGDNPSEEFMLDEKLNELISENLIAKKSVEELVKDEEILTSYLNKLKKENFKLETSVNAWKTALRNKLEEFKEAGLKLDEIHNEIQSEREDFCSKLDEFNDEYGVLSKWWEEQMNFLSQLENLEEKTFDEQKCKEEIKKLEKHIEDIKKQIETLQAEKQVVQVEVHLSPEGEPFLRSHDEEVSPKTLPAKKVRASEEEEEEEEEDDEIICEGEELKTEEVFYTLVDVEKVRMANRRNQRRDVLETIKTFMKM